MVKKLDVFCFCDLLNRAVVRNPYDDILKNMFRSRSLFLIFILSTGTSLDKLFPPNIIRIIILYCIFIIINVLLLLLLLLIIG